MDNFIAHILVVDDDEGIRSLVKKYLNENNFLVSTADSAESASKKIEIPVCCHEIFSMDIIFVSNVEIAIKNCLNLNLQNQFSSKSINRQQVLLRTSLNK